MIWRALLIMLPLRGGKNLVFSACNWWNFFSGKMFTWVEFVLMAYIKNTTIWSFKLLLYIQFPWYIPAFMSLSQTSVSSFYLIVEEPWHTHACKRPCLDKMRSVKIIIIDTLPLLDSDIWLAELRTSLLFPSYLSEVLSSPHFPEYWI